MGNDLLVGIRKERTRTQGMGVEVVHELDRLEVFIFNDLLNEHYLFPI